MICFFKKMLFKIILKFRGKRTLPREFILARAPRFSDGTNKFTDNQRATEDSVVFVGDSMTYYANWSKALPGIHTANLGVGGDTTEKVLARISSIVKIKPKAIFLRIGINDLQGNLIPCEYVPRYNEIVSTIRAGSPTTKLYCMSICPIGKPFEDYHYDIKRRIREYNEFITALCELYGATYVDDHYLLAGPDGWLLQQNYADALHLSPTGYMIVFRNIKKFLDQG